MKKLIAIAAIFGAFSAFAGRTTWSGSLNVTSTVSEADVIAKAEAMIPGVVNFTNKKIRKEAGYRGCTRRARDIRFDLVNVTKYFKSYDNMTLEPVYRAAVRYTFTNCQDND